VAATASVLASTKSRVFQEHRRRADRFRENPGDPSRSVALISRTEPADLTGKAQPSTLPVCALPVKELRSWVRGIARGYYSVLAMDEKRVFTAVATLFMPAIVATAIRAATRAYSIRS